jgi:hypothetical protein
LRFAELLVTTNTTTPQRKTNTEPKKQRFRDSYRSSSVLETDFHYKQIKKLDKTPPLIVNCLNHFFPTAPWRLLHITLNIACAGNLVLSSRFAGANRTFKLWQFVAQPQFSVERCAFKTCAEDIFGSFCFFCLNIIYLNTYTYKRV